jgi:cytochrome c-type biogenesis protein CcmE
MEYTVTISDDAQAGYEYQAGVEGTTEQALIDKFAEEKGVSYWHNMKRAQTAEVVKAIEKHPEAYLDAVLAIKAVKDAEDEAARKKAAEEAAKLEELEGKA